MQKYLLVVYMLFPSILANAQNNIKSWEYWFNADYSTVIRTDIPTSDTFEIDDQIDVSLVGFGLNQISFRFQDETGRWGPLSSAFIVNYPGSGLTIVEKIEYIEYWFDADYKSAVRLEAENTGTLIMEQLIDVSGIDNGLHQLNFRFSDDNGKWSPVSSAFVVVYPGSGIVFIREIKQAEYWFDTNYASSVKTDFSSSDTLRIDELIDVSSLANGLHTVNYRFKDERGIWTPVNSGFFAKFPWSGTVQSSKITEYEYRVEDNSGVAIGGDETTGYTRIKYETPVDTAEIDLIIDLREKPMGNYIIHFRAKDSRGIWGGLQTREITKQAAPVARFSTNTSTICAGSFLQVVNESIDANLWFWDFGDGNTSGEFEPEYIFTQEGDYEVSLTATDSVSGRDSTISHIVTVLPTFNAIETAEICEGEVFEWFGNEYDSEGIYSMVYTASNGCDSIITLQLAVNHVFNVLYSGPGETLDYLINDSFEDVEAGSLGGWIKLYNGTGDANQKVVDNMAKNGIKSLQLEGASSWASEYYKQISGEHEKLVIEGWINVEIFLSGLTGGFGLADKDIGIWGTRTSRLQFYNGRINVTYYPGGLTYDIQSYTPGVWYHIRMEHDLVAKVYSVFINGEKVSGTSGNITTDEFPMHPTIESRQFLLFAGNSGTTKVFFDDLKMYEGTLTEICSNELPFVFGSQSINETGIYTEIFQTVNGCDSIVTLNLVVNQSYDTTENLTICESELPYQFGTQSLTESGEYNEIFSLSTGCDSVVNLKLKVIDCSRICNTLNLRQGWNIFSVNNIPDSTDLTYVFQPLIDNGSLVKIQDELGNSLEDWGIFGGWTNNIGNSKPDEGYKIKVGLNDSIEICGIPVEYPYAIALRQGWNIIGYPQTTPFDGMENIVQQLIDIGSLVKVQDELGSSIEDWGIFGGWQNNIGNFNPGEGYKIKVSTQDTLWIYESYTKSSVLLPVLVATTHFKTEFEGNGVDHMNINLVGLPLNVLKAGDELAVFDGTTCVGAVTILPTHLHCQKVSIVASATDNQGMAGFGEGNPIIIKLWNSQNNQEITLEPEIVKGTSIFTKYETTIANLEKYDATGLEAIPESGLPEINCYPNPFRNEVTIELKLAIDSEVEVEVLTQLGQHVKYVTTKQLLSGELHKFTWNGCNANNQQVSPGIYHLKVNINGKVVHKKVVYSK
ncbi:MAG: PKD domain-containing protein [Draconibacterium sp.]